MRKKDHTIFCRQLDGKGNKTQRRLAEHELGN